MTLTGLSAKAHATLQSLLLVVDALNVDTLSAQPWFHVIPKKYAGWVLFVVAVTHAAVGLYHHYVNPDGTSAAVAYVPPGK